MTDTRQPPAPDADARFAAYLADLKAHVDDPERGADSRALLSDDPDTQRGLFDLAEAAATGDLAQPLVRQAFLATLVLVSVATLITVLAMWLVL